MSDSLRLALRPAWLAAHAATAAIVTGLVVTAQWQFRTAPKHGVSIRHISFALELYVFALFTLAMWAKALRDAKRKSSGATSGPADRVEAELQGILDGPVTYRRYVSPQMDSTPPDTSDPVRAAYNNHLSQLAQNEAHA